MILNSVSFQINPIASPMWNNNNNYWDKKVPKLDDTSEDEVGITKGIRELELRFQSEIEEHEKLWLHPEEISSQN